MRPLAFVRTRPRVEEVARLEEQVGRVLDNLRERVLAGGLTLADNFQGVLVRLEGVVAPDPWVPLTLLNGCTAWNAGNAPRARWADGWWECRELIRYPLGFPVGYGTPVARLPGTVTGGNRECATVADNLFAQVTAFPASAGAPGDIYFVSGQPNPTPSTSYLSLNGVRFATAQPPPEWPTASQVRRVLPPGTLTPTGHLLMGVTARDGTPVGAVTVDLVTERTGGEMVLRLRRASGLTPGKSYTLTLFLLTG